MLSNQSRASLTALLATDNNYSIPSLAAGVPSQQSSVLLDEFARKRKAAQIAVPTDDLRVRAELRARGEPITLFGEKREDRRDRLREILFAAQEGADDDDSMLEGDEDEEDEEVPTEFFTKGSEELRKSRQDILKFSIPRANQRVAFQKAESTISVQTHVQHRHAIKENLGAFELFGSQIACGRAVSAVRFHPKGELLAVGDWTGSVQLLNVPNLDTKMVLRGHRAMIGGLAWHPDADITSTPSPGTISLASSGGQGDNDIHLWSLAQDTPVATLSGHSGRVCKIEFHPSGKYLASASYDTTWRLWDVATTTELLSQEGHSREVYAVGFQSDGSLIATAGLDSIGRVWDLRTGKAIMVLEGHAQPIYGLDWNPDGFRIATGSVDGFAKVWDVRAVRESASIGANVGGVTEVRWFKGSDGPSMAASPLKRDSVMNGDSSHDTEDEYIPKKSGTFLVSGGFDKAVNVFSSDDWALCKSLTGHDGAVLSADISTDAQWIASCGRDRTVKLWASDVAGGF
jgi:U4/U6 small nuclear ribonucleoprotein PRP4